MERFGSIGTSQIGAYQIDKRLGAGGMATVYKGFHIERPEQPVAIKILSEEYLEEEAICDRFRLETEIQLTLDHPHIVKAYELLDEPGMLGLVMEWVDGTHFKRFFLKRDEAYMSLDEVKQYFYPILDAIHHAHAHNIIHRDLKPSNLMMAKQRGEDGEERYAPKVIDFGLAKDLLAAEVSHSAGLGTPRYMPPEQLRGQRPTRGVDVYSLGATLFHMVTGHVPFEGIASTVMCSHMSDVPPNIFPHRPDLPEHIAESLNSVILHAMKKSPEHRFHSCLAFKKALDDALHGRVLRQQRVHGTYEVNMNNVIKAIEYESQSNMYAPLLAAIQHQKTDQASDVDGFASDVDGFAPTVQAPSYDSFPAYENEALPSSPISSMEESSSPGFTALDERESINDILRLAHGNLKQHAAEDSNAHSVPSFATLPNLEDDATRDLRKQTPATQDTEGQQVPLKDEDAFKTVFDPMDHKPQLAPVSATPAPEPSPQGPSWRLMATVAGLCFVAGAGVLLLLLLVFNRI